MLPFESRRNPWKTAVLAIGTVLALAAAAAFGTAAARGYQTYNYLNAVVGTVGDKPITRANFIDLQLAREAQAAAAKPEGK